MNADKENQEQIEHDALAPYVVAWLVFIAIALILLGWKLFFGLASLYAAKQIDASGDRKLKTLRAKDQ